MPKKKVITKKKLEDQQKFFLEIGNKVEALRSSMYFTGADGVQFPTSLDIYDDFPMEVQLLEAQFKALYCNCLTIFGSYHNRIALTKE